MPPEMDPATLDPEPEVDPFQEPPLPETPPEPQLVRIRISGDTFEVPEHIADALQKRELEFQRKLSEQGAELGRLRQQPRSDPPATQVPSPVSNPDEDLTFFQSPTLAIQRVTEKLREELRQELRQEVAQGLSLEDQRKEYWSQFYKENPDFVGRERLVNTVIVQEFNTLKDLSPDESRKALAGTLREMLGQPPVDKKPLPQGRAQSERSSNPSLPKPAPQTEETPRLGLSAELKARAARRRQAQYATKD